MSSEAQTLVEATRLFLARHEEALASGEPARGVDACEGLLEGLAVTLPAELERLSADGLRHQTARRVFERRLSEMEGLAMQLKLGFHQLATGNVDAMRLVALLTATRRQLRALDATLALWGAEHGGAAPPAPPAADAMRAAREALGAGCALAGREALRVALARAGKSADIGTGDDLVTAWSALDVVDEILKRP